MGSLGYGWTVSKPLGWEQKTEIFCVMYFRVFFHSVSKCGCNHCNPINSSKFPSHLSFSQSNNERSIVGNDCGNDGCEKRSGSRWELLPCPRNSHNSCSTSGARMVEERPSGMIGKCWVTQRSLPSPHEFQSGVTTRHPDIQYPDVSRF